LDGSIRILNKDGLEAMTTTRVAEAAGVSVGTLYQYFANRDAILDALQDREFERAISMLQQNLAREDFLTSREQARAVVEGLLRLYRDSPGLHRVLVIDGMRVSPHERVLAFDRRVIDSLRGFFELTPFGVKRANKQAAAFVLYHSVRATLLAAILEEPSGVSDVALADEVTDLVVGHLMGGVKAPLIA
jgi:AcrR family transcriptional regulator